MALTAAAGSGTNPGRQDAIFADLESASVASGSTLLRFQFLGSGAEYFKIWIVNIALSILTLGIYSAWAKVRNKQYFYANTLLQGSVFEYTARPLSILKGRVIVIVLFILYSLVGNLSALGAKLALLVLLLAIPFFVQRSLMFNARNSSYRNLRFSFDGRWRTAMVVFCGVPFLLLLAIFGGVAAAKMLAAPGLAILVLMLVLLLGLPYWLYRQQHYVIDHSHFGTAGFVFSGRYGEFLRLAVQLLLCILVAFILAALLLLLLGWGLGLSLAQLQQASGPAELSPLVFGLGAVAVYAAFGLCYLLPFSYYSVQLNNLLFNASRLRDNRLVCRYELASYTRLVVVNTVLTLLTVGLYRPWARVNTARYKARHMALLAATSIDDFVAAEAQQVSALGEEFGELYDLDFGI